MTDTNPTLNETLRRMWTTEDERLNLITVPYERLYEMVEMKLPVKYWYDGAKWWEMLERLDRKYNCGALTTCGIL